MRSADDRRAVGVGRGRGARTERVRGPVHGPIGDPLGEPTGDAGREPQDDELSERPAAAREEPVLGVHVPVLLEQVLELLAAAPALREGSPWLVDATVGAGGHARALLEALPTVHLLGLDQDPEILAHARTALEPFGARVRLRHGRLSELGRTIRKERIAPPAGILFDLGVSSLQLDTAARGFSFQADGPLDMRMDPTRDRTAADVVNRWDEGDLADLLYYEGGETAARRIARAIVQARRNTPFQRTAALADVIAQALGPGAQRAKIHPATRTFQALRRAVNEEGEELARGLEAAEHWLAPGGRLVVIGFHSGEDRTVKRAFASLVSERGWRLLTRRPLAPDAAEERANRRARSARLRAIERPREDLPAAASAPEDAPGEDLR